jgi:BED zinc finger
VQATRPRGIRKLDTLTSPPSTSQTGRASPSQPSQDSPPSVSGLRNPLSDEHKDLVLPPSTTSMIWKHFLVEKDNIGSPGYCNYCDMGVSRGKSHTTSNMIAHLKKYHPEEYVVFFAEEEPNSQQNDCCFGANKQNIVKDALIEMMVEGHIPFTMLKLRGLKKIFAALGSRERVPDKRTVQKRMAVIETDTKCKLRSLLVGKKVSLTCDGWKSNNNVDYLGITACWVDDVWKLQTVTLDCTVFPGRHFATRMAERVQYILKG